MHRRAAEKGTGWGTRVPDAICGTAAPARLTCGCSFHGNGRRPGGARAQFPQRSFSGPGAQPRAGLPHLRLGLGPFRRHRFFLPLAPVPEPLGPGTGQRQQLFFGIGRRGHSWQFPGRSDCCLAGPRCSDWAGGRAGAPCCCPRRDSGLGEVAVSAPPPPQLLQLRPSCRLPLSAFQLLLHPSTSSRPRPGRCLRSSSYCRRRRRCCLATPKPVITQVEKACLVRVFLCTRQPPVCRPRLGDVPHPLESSSHLGENQRGWAGRNSPQLKSDWLGKLPSQLIKLNLDWCPGTRGKERKLEPSRPQFWGWPVSSAEGTCLRGEGWRWLLTDGDEGICNPEVKCCIHKLFPKQNLK